MKWDQEIFNRNIERLIQEKCAGIQIRFNEIVESRDAATRWKKEKPSFDSILTITEKFNTSVDDLISDPDPHKDALADFSLVPKYRARLSGGPGAYAWTQDVESHLSFKNAWLNGKCKKDAAALFEVRGDSMSPLITDGDIVLVDTSKNVPQDLVEGKIYAFSEGDRVKVKRLMWRGADLWAISENKTESPDAPVDKDGFNLIGKVIWVGHEVR